MGFSAMNRLNHTNKVKKSESEERKSDALELAQLLYDIYIEDVENGFEVKDE